jgi:DUF4097 and DUF4098 domain-containing protein YvlB
MRTTIIVLASLLLGVTHADAQQGTRQVNERFPASAEGSLRVSNVSGRIEIQGWDRNEITVTGTLGPMVERLDIRQGENAVIEVVVPQNSRGDAHARLTIRVPAGRRIEVGNVSGGIVISEVRGNVNANVVSGGIQISGSSSDVRARTVSGGIVVRGVTGSADLNTVSGGITVEGGTLSRLSARAVSGGVRYRGGLTPGAHASIEVHSGTVDLVLPSGIGADFDVQTFSGRITNELGPAAQRTSRHGPGWELRFTAGGGGASVHVKTFSGSVRIARQ